MKKLFLPVICVLLFCLCGCSPYLIDPFNFGVYYYTLELPYPKAIKINEEVIFTTHKRIDLYENPWIVTFEDLPENVTIEWGEKSEKFSTKEMFCVKTSAEKDDDASGPKVDVEASVRFSFDTPGEYTIKVNAFQDNGQEAAEKYYPQESFTYTITVTE